MRGFIALLLLAHAATGWGQSDPRRPSADEIVKRLAPADSGPGTKGISVERPQQPPAEAPSIDLEVNFETGSAVLTDDAVKVLDNLGKAMATAALQSSRFLIAGHTDAAGSDEYNRALSMRRAQAVADYLAFAHRVERARMRVEGFGKTRLLDAANPLSALNRRVQVANLGAQ